MRKVIHPGNRITRGRKKTGKCFFVMINDDPVTIMEIRQLANRAVNVEFIKNEDPVICIGDMRIPRGDYLVRVEEDLFHLSWKSFHAIYERVPNDGTEHLETTTVIKFDFWDRLRIMWESNMRVSTCVKVDNPVAIVHTEGDIFIEPTGIDRFVKYIRNHWYLNGESSYNKHQNDQCMSNGHIP